MRKFLFLIFSFTCLNSFSQTMKVSGTVQDTSGKEPVANAVSIAVRIKDSLLINFTRSDKAGNFSLTLPVDTYKVTVSHPKFGDREFFLFGSENNKDIIFGKVILPPKSELLNEVVIFAYKDPIYYNGDTLVYTADSFKVKPNATVEDLLKKLPGIKVDAQGKITSQGKAVDQVLVDGDEFFGTDPTVATKNLNATSLESVQVYDKKNESSTDESNETIKVMDLKLKEEAKKGYFGKVSAASDFQKFYESDFLANKFNNKRKVSLFGLASNTPRSGFGWEDTYKYGLDNEMNMHEGDDGERYFYMTNDNNDGIFKTLKAGFYYNEKFSKDSKLSFNYTYSPNEKTSTSETRSQYFLPDTTYTTNNISFNKQKSESHSINADWDYNIDSLTEIEIKPKFKLITADNTRNEINDFISGSDTLVRRTTTFNTSSSDNYEASSDFKLNRRFKKPDRKLILTYNFVLTDKDSKGNLKSVDTFYDTTGFGGNNIDQKKTSTTDNISHYSSIAFVEPLTKKIRLEFGYDYALSDNKQIKEAFNSVNGEYSVLDSTFSNSFNNKRTTQRAGFKFVYEEKKQTFSAGARYRSIHLINNNLMSGASRKLNVDNVLPYMKYTYKFSDNKRLQFDYKTSSRPPDINQLQPVPDNTNPNRIQLGNPDLRPTFQQDVNVNFNSYKPITGSYLWSSVYFGITNHDISNSITYDSLGRTITQPVNINGNYNSGFYFSSSFPVFNKLLEISPNINGNHSKQSSFVNGIRSTTMEYSLGPGLDISVETDDLEFTVGASYDYNKSESSLSTLSAKPFTTARYHAELDWELPKKFIFTTSANYTANDRRTQGYNINYLIWNASLGKTFLKRENLIISVDAVDILNENISTRRTIQDNIITDIKTNVVGRYILLKAVYKFNSSKEKEEDEF